MMMIHGGEETALYELVTQKKKWILTKQVVRYPYGIHDLFYVFTITHPANLPE